MSISIIHKVRAVEHLYENLEKETLIFTQKSGLHCKESCGKCCNNLEIEVSPLEFLPWAFTVFMNGRAELMLEELKHDPDSICHLYTHLSLLDDDIGKCSDYLHRGLVCRLFASAASKDKHGRLNLATCKIIKIEHEELYLKTEEEINKDLSIPVFSDYYMKLSQIDFRMSNILLPINQALKMAIEEVLNYYAYRPYPHGIKSTA